MIYGLLSVIPTSIKYLANHTMILIRKASAVFEAASPVPLPAAAAIYFLNIVG
jgi:hypothetical protein